MVLFRFLPLLPVVVVAFNAGCIKRKEVIAVHADGAVALHCTMEGDPSDIRGGDAMPTADSGWHVEDRIEVDDDGDETLIKTATRRVPAGEPLPDSYALPGTRSHDIALRFPTALTVEERHDGKYYHFRRVYQRRAFAFANFWERQVLESDKVKAISDKEPGEITPQEKELVAGELIKMDRQMTASFLEAAGSRLEEPLPQDVFLHAARRALDVYNSEELALFDQVAEIVTQDGHSDHMDDLENRVREATIEAFRTALTESGVKAQFIERLTELYQRSRDAYKITEDLGDEEWSVIVEMPGRITAHNSTDTPPPPVEGDQRRGRALQEPHGTTIAWSFEGAALRDREVVLMATSFVPWASAEKAE